ncbi:hypothetical protein [Halogeometricum sp. CBA1124]|uniref:hypothetical protein n=1 Tax=Halogeometricum sp. CBA1124 TaxID=2668071 RepID=UPI00142A675F|nr:hypothetical protein [Halogeometricum sp. CBA1124]MUV56100.1 hypothetical protein [Halogeometricum sp. CBA1124]
MKEWEHTNLQIHARVHRADDQVMFHLSRNGHQIDSGTFDEMDAAVEYAEETLEKYSDDLGMYSVEFKVPASVGVRAASEDEARSRARRIYRDSGCELGQPFGFEATREN